MPKSFPFPLLFNINKSCYYCIRVYKLNTCKLLYAKGPLAMKFCNCATISQGKKPIEFYFIVWHLEWEIIPFSRFKDLFIIQLFCKQHIHLRKFVYCSNEDFEINRIEWRFLLEEKFCTVLGGMRALAMYEQSVMCDSISNPCVV